MRIPEELANVAIAAPGVLGAFFLAANGHVAYRYVSPRSKVVFGLDANDILADAGLFFKRLHREDLGALNARLSQSAQDMTPYFVEFRFDHQDKGWIWLEAGATPVHDPETGVLWYGYAADVTRRKRAELALAETAARLQATIDGAQDAILTLNGSGVIQSVNRAGAAMFGIRAYAMVGLPVEDILDIGPFNSSVESFVELANDESGAGRNALGLRHGDETFPVEFSLSEASFVNQRLFILFVKDLSRQRLIEKRVEELRRNRLDAMGGMAATLAHEINQPLAATATYLKVARRMLEKHLLDENGEVLDVLDKAASQTLRAGRIVTSLRDLIQRGEPDKTLVGVNDLVREACNSMRSESETVNICIEMQCRARNDQVVADRIQLRQVLGNLIRNAMEAMRSAEMRMLLISTDNPDDATIRVDVTDTGCGFELAEDDCFEPFTSTKVNGMGIGLSICRSIIEAHYGSIWAKANTNGGAVFSFTLPLQNADIEA